MTEVASYSAVQTVGEKNTTNKTSSVRNRNKQIQYQT